MGLNSPPPVARRTLMGLLLRGRVAAAEVDGRDPSCESPSLCVRDLPPHIRMSKDQKVDRSAGMGTQSGAGTLMINPHMDLLFLACAHIGCKCRTTTPMSDSNSSLHALKTRQCGTYGQQRRPLGHPDVALAYGAQAFARGQPLVDAVHVELCRRKAQYRAYGSVEKSEDRHSAPQPRLRPANRSTRRARASSRSARDRAPHQKREQLLHYYDRQRFRKPPSLKLHA